MKVRVQNRLMDIARHHKALRVLCMVVFVAWLFFYHLFHTLFHNMRKVTAVAAVCCIFVLTSSFTFAEDEIGNYESYGIYVTTTDGTAFEVENMDDMDDETNGGYSETGATVSADDAADMRDLENAISRNSASSVESTSDFQTDESARIYSDEEGSYVNADYADDWSLILINKHNHIPDDYEFELETIRGNVKSDTRVMPHVLEMLKAAQEDGVNLYICSPYRTPEKQQLLFARKMKSYTMQGYSEAEAYDLASQTVAIPGTSEHEVGLAFDFIIPDYQQLDAGFGDTDGGKWLKEHAAEYGFILRYPKGKETITEIEYEPWHYRYVGEAAAKEIMGRELCLEEYDREIGLVD